MTKLNKEKLRELVDSAPELVDVQRNPWLYAGWVQNVKTAFYESEPIQAVEPIVQSAPEAEDSGPELEAEKPMFVPEVKPKRRRRTAV